MTRQLLRLLIISFLASSFFSCGGGGSSNPTPPPAQSNPVPTINSISPNSAVAGTGSMQVTVVGSGFIATSSVLWNDLAHQTTYLDATRLQITLSATEVANAGSASISVTNPSPGGGTSSHIAFQVNNPQPTITSISPNTVVAGAANTTVDVTGTGLLASSVVFWNDTALQTNFINSTLLRVSIPSSVVASAGTASLSVVNPSPGGGTTSGVLFQINNPVPTIASLSPASVTAGASDAVISVKGIGFFTGSVVLWNNSPMATTFVSGTEVTFPLAAEALTGSSENTVLVQNPGPGGGVSAAASFNVNSPAPEIASISPNTVQPGFPAVITIVGTGFESNSVVEWNGSARPTTFVNTTTLRVSLNSSDLATETSGSLVVLNPAPNLSASSAALLTVARLVPKITGVSIVSTSSGGFSGCPQLQVRLTGENFSSHSLIQANGTQLQAFTYLGVLTSISSFLPTGFVSKSGELTFTVTNPGPVPITSAPFAYPATAPTVLTLCGSPLSPTVYPDSAFTFLVQPTAINTTSNRTVTLGSLPSGLTATTSTIALPDSGASFHLQASSSTVPGPYDLDLNGTDGTATSANKFHLIVGTGTPQGFSFVSPIQKEVGIPFGGSGTITFNSFSNGGGANSPIYDVIPSLNGLPSGTTASFSPTVFSPGQSVSVSISSITNAPVAQNAKVTLVGTPVANAPAATSDFYVDVTAPPGSLPVSRTDFIATAGTPYAGVYDRTHELIFASNPDWNRVDVISNATRKIVKSIPILSPRGLDITQDDSRVWVQTASQFVFEINTSTLHAVRHALPDQTFGSDGTSSQGVNSSRLLALSDGTLYLYFDRPTGGFYNSSAIWNPATNQLSTLSSGFTSFYSPVRSSDGNRVYTTRDSSGMGVYDVPSQTFNVVGSGSTYGTVLAVNHDGSRIVTLNIWDLQMYDGSLNLLGTVPADVDPFPIGLGGGIVFSADDTKMYVIGSPYILTIDAQSLQVLAKAPSVTAEPVGISGGEATTTPFAMEPQGLLIGLQNYGIAFEDPSFSQNYVENQPGFTYSSNYGVFDSYAGPLAGGSSFSLYLFPSLTPDVWFGQTRGTADISNFQLSITSPPGTTSGPVNVKLIYPSGVQMYYPQSFSYSAVPTYAVTSGSSPDGGAPAQIVGYGLPRDASGGTIKVGANAAAITTTIGQYPPLSEEHYPSLKIGYMLPPGEPGWADVQVSTPIGSGTLPHAVFYARAVRDYSSTDTFNSLLVDDKRGLVYLSAGDHIDVFSISSSQFVSPLYPAAVGTLKKFTGMALTPDGSKLLIANLLDQSLAVVDPETGSGSVIAMPNTNQFDPQCSVGPLYVAAGANNVAFVATGGFNSSVCNNSGSVYLVDLQTQAATLSFGGAYAVDASGDGNYVAIGASYSFQGCVYSVVSRSCAKEQTVTHGFGAAISSDANVVGSNRTLSDVAGNLLGSISQPVPLYGGRLQNWFPNQSEMYPLFQSRFNDSGSLWYRAFPNYFEIVDVQHGTLLIRFSLTQTVQNMPSPIAIDSGGRMVFLLTDKGLTVVDLGSAPLAIGHIDQPSAAPGTAVVVRGSGFDSATTATVGGVGASVQFSDENTLTLIVPAAQSGPQDIVLTRSDGEVYTLENGIVLP